MGLNDLSRFVQAEICLEVLAGAALDDCKREASMICAAQRVRVSFVRNDQLYRAYPNSPWDVLPRGLGKNRLDERLL